MVLGCTLVVLYVLYSFRIAPFIFYNILKPRQSVSYKPLTHHGGVYIRESNQTIDGCGVQKTHAPP